MSGSLVADMLMTAVLDDGLGNSSCLVDLGGGRALALATQLAATDRVTVLASRLGLVDGDEVDLGGGLTLRALVCGHGERAMGAASLLARTDHADVSFLADPDWAAATGLPLDADA